MSKGILEELSQVLCNEAQNRANNMIEEKTRTLVNSAGIIVPIMQQTFGMISGFFNIKSIADYVKELNGVGNMLGKMTQTESERILLQEKLYLIAQKTRHEMVATAELYQRIYNLTMPMQLSQNNQLRLVELINKSMVVGMPLLQPNNSNQSDVSHIVQEIFNQSHKINAAFAKISGGFFNSNQKNNMIEQVHSFLAKGLLALDGYKNNLMIISGQVKDIISSFVAIGSIRFLRNLNFLGLDTFLLNLKDGMKILPSFTRALQGVAISVAQIAIPMALITANLTVFKDIFDTLSTQKETAIIRFSDMLGKAGTPIDWVYQQFANPSFDFQKAIPIPRRTEEATHLLRPNMTNHITLTVNTQANNAQAVGEVVAGQLSDMFKKYTIGMG